MCLMQSLGKYNLNCYASEIQLTSGKFREFMAQPTGEDEWPIKIVVKAVGLQEVNANDSTVQEIELHSDVKVWVFNCSTHINEDGKPFHPTNSSFIWIDDNYVEIQEMLKQYRM